MNHPAITTWSEEEQTFRMAVRDFGASVIKPKVREMEKNQRIDPDIIKQLFEMGLMGIESPEDLGGSASTFTMACIAIEELGRIDGSVSVLVDVQNTLVINAFLNYANPELQKKFLPKLSSNCVGAYALSESGSGSDAFALNLKASPEGNRFKLNGHKLWITNAKEADLFLVFANAQPELGYKGITCFVIEKNTPGFSVGKKEDKLGIRASSTCELLFENCEVSKDHILGETGKGYKIAIETLNEGRIGIGAQMLGIARGAYEASLNYIQKREQFGKPLSHFQGVQFQLAEMRTQLEAARLMVYNAARLKDSGKSFIKEAGHGPNSIPHRLPKPSPHQPLIFLEETVLPQSTLWKILA